MNQLTLPLTDAKESREERLRRVLAGIPSLTLGSALTFTDTAYAEATRLAKAAGPSEATQAPQFPAASASRTESLP